MLETIKDKLDGLQRERDEKVKAIEIEHKENLAALQKEAEAVFNKNLERVRLEYEEACAQLRKQAQREESVKASKALHEASLEANTENGVRWDDGHWHEPQDEGELLEYRQCVRPWNCKPEAHHGRTLKLTCRCGARKFINFKSLDKQESSVWHTLHLKQAERNNDRVQEALSRTLARLGR